jgi:hypothetical protein
MRGFTPITLSRLSYYSLKCASGRPLGLKAFAIANVGLGSLADRMFKRGVREIRS